MSDKHQETTTLESETSAQTKIAGASNVVVHQAPGSSFVLNQNDDQCLKYLDPSDKEIRLVVIGRTGEGKSSTCNSILEEKCFKSRAGFDSRSKRAKYVKRNIDGYEMSIVDTPGIFDTDDEQFETLLEVMKCLVLSSPGPHAFLLVISVQRYTNEAREAVAILRKYFGADALSKTIIVFTRKDELDYDGVTVQEALNQAPDDLKCLIQECGKRCVWFNNKAKGQENKRQVSDLLQKVTAIKQTGESRFFSSKIYDQVETRLKKEASKVSQVHKEELKKLQEIIVEQKQQIEVLNIDPLSTNNKAELKQLMTKLDANKILFDEKKITMDNIIIRMRETMRESLVDDIFIHTSVGGTSGAAIGLLGGLGVGIVLGAVGGVIVGFTNGLHGYLKRRKSAKKTSELIEQMNQEISEVLGGLNESRKRKSKEGQTLIVSKKGKS